MEIIKTFTIYLVVNFTLLIIYERMPEILPKAFREMLDKHLKEPK